MRPVVAAQTGPVLTLRTGLSGAAGLWHGCMSRLRDPSTEMPGAGDRPAAAVAGLRQKRMRGPCFGASIMVVIDGEALMAAGTACRWCCWVGAGDGGCWADAWPMPGCDRSRLDVLVKGLPRMSPERAAEGCETPWS